MKKIKVCYFNGSNRANGRTNKIINLFLEILCKNSKFDYKFINLIEEGTQIKTCIGCLNCFKKGICPLDDSITKIKQTMMNSDIVVFATPVYMGFVSGQMKIFLDRLSLWTHLQKLLTKKCVLIVVTQNTSLDETTKYLYEVVSNFGLEIIGCITLRINDSYDNIEQQIELVTSRINRQFYYNVNSFPNFYRRGLFTNLQTHYRSYYQIKYFTYETNYWKQKNYLDEKATLEYILNNYVEEDENGRGSVK